jgi:predicted dehydrogenase
LRNTASHWFDGLLAAGAEVQSVLAVPVLSGDDPTPTALMQLAGGGTVSLHAGSVQDYMVYETELLLTSGRIRLWAAGGRGSAEHAAPSPRFSEYRELQPLRAAFPLGLSNAMLAMADDAVSSLLEDRPMLCTVEDAVKVHILLDAVDRSLANSTWIEV